MLGILAHANHDTHISVQFQLKTPCHQKSTRDSDTTQQSMWIGILCATTHLLKLSAF